MARQFNGTTDKLVRNDAALAPLPLTLACWFVASDLSAVRKLLSFGSSASNNPFVALRVRGDLAGDPLSAVHRDDALTAGESQAGSVAGGVWQHGAAVFAGSASRTAYLDGTAGTTDTTATAATTVDRTAVGALERLAAANFWSGLIAHAAVWWAALTAAEVAALASGASPLSIRPASLAAYWPLRGLACDRPERDVVRGLGLTVNGTTWASDPPVGGPDPLFEMQDGSPILAIGRSRIPLIVHHSRRKRA